jgi:hypothetical protein
LTKRKYIDLSVLLLISALVVSASAAVYYAMAMQSTSTIGPAAVYFIAGGDSSGILFLGTNNTYARLSLSAYPNVTLYYEQAVNLTATAAKQVQLRHVSITPNNSPSVSNFTSIVFKLIRADGTEVGTLTYTTSGTQWTVPTAGSGFISIANGEKLAIKVEIRAAAGATSGVATTIVIDVDVR